MKSVLTLMNWFSAIVIAVLAITARAAEPEASHRIVSSANDGMGLSTITLEITITNNSSTDLTAMTLQLMPSPKVRIIGTPQLEIDNLGTGTTTSVHCLLHSPLPPEFVAGTHPLRYIGEALDATGSQVPVYLTSIPMH
jgi:hypothetical protein